MFDRKCMFWSGELRLILFFLIQIADFVQTMYEKLPKVDVPFRGHYRSAVKRQVATRFRLSVLRLSTQVHHGRWEQATISLVNGPMYQTH